MSNLITDQPNRSKSPWLLLSAIIFFILLLSAVSGLIVFNNQYKNKIYPNVFIGQINLGGQSAEAAKQLINREVDKISQTGLTFSYKNTKAVVPMVISSADGDLAYQIINFNTDQAAAAALNYGKDDNFIINLKNELMALKTKKQLPLGALINRDQVIKILKANFSQVYEPAQDARLSVNKFPSHDYEFSVTKEKFGKTIDFETAINNLTDNLSQLNSTEIKLTTITEYPKIFARDCLNLETKARALLAIAPLTLKYGDNKWLIDQDQLTQFLSLKTNNSANDKVTVALDDQKFKDYLSQEIAPAIDKKSLEAKFTIKDGRVTEFQNGQDGLTLDIDSSFAKINQALTNLASGQGKLPDLEAGSPAPGAEIELTVQKQTALVTTGDVNNLGIKEIVGIGTSNFAGSPPNRRHNIKIGGNSVNGLLIKPGEEFSLLKALGKVDGSSGYLPELVIKDNKTTPEFGGGLCQVGTTMFRAALASGLPITMRRNHSYRVQYYEPAGTDATIYDPWPDFRFINDTADYILIQTKIATDTLAFEFWGTRDGRQVEKTKSTIYNIVKPEPTKIIETLDLKPGVKKCTEHAHNGADAYFDYQVTYANGEIKKKRFSSHYVPWQEVCLLGVKELPPPAGGPPLTATATPALTN